MKKAVWYNMKAYRGWMSFAKRLENHTIPWKQRMGIWKDTMKGEDTVE